ncbi:hypothetical protein TELCIR_22025, partial [Teladorsagia circumcincta]
MDQWRHADCADVCYQANTTAYMRDDSWEERWVQSKHKDDYGEFKLSTGKYFGDAKRDQGLKTSQDAKFYSRAAKFPK